ncbi:hypothetical protein AAU01_01920 [Paenarthrobacter aurescens]|uniref:CD-NTase-associated protein 12/Pycsar effector protein TIR domain-containing protein n=1 Tax=Paenarthrobacter aurescens TaxID=43663 RepID=A0A4Y3N890_PAEAU|nr:hypothetical protein AAU01_01920 [Paenarthrobacter aurescens]
MVHGRDLALRDQLIGFLRYIDTSPIGWTEARFKTGRPSPTTLEIVTTGLKLAQAVIVLFSPDDEAKLKDEYLAPHDGPDERQLTGQPRQNVLLEAGMAWAIAPERTVMVRAGHPRHISDIDGINWINLNNDFDSRRSLVDALINAEVDVNDRLDLLHPASGRFDSKAKHPQINFVWAFSWQKNMGRLVYRGIQPITDIRVRYHAHGANHPIEQERLEPGESISLPHFIREKLGDDVEEDVWISWSDSSGQVQYDSVRGTV